METTISTLQEFDVSQVVASNIRAEAGRMGITQMHLANALGVTQGTIAIRWHGRRQWQLRDLATVARVLHTTVADLVTPRPGVDYTVETETPAPENSDTGVISSRDWTRTSNRPIIGSTWILAS